MQVLEDGSPGRGDVLGDVPRVTQLLWTSDQKFCGEGVPPEHRREFCSVLNAALRNDDQELLTAAMALIRAINSLCIVRGERPEARLRFPPAHCCFRGGGLPDAHRSFFQAGLKYRVPGLLATSFDREARPSLARAAAELRPCCRCCTVAGVALLHVLHQSLRLRSRCWSRWTTTSVSASMPQTLGRR